MLVVVYSREVVSTVYEQIQLLEYRYVVFMPVPENCVDIGRSVTNDKI